jgi:hypothetical protein
VLVCAQVGNYAAGCASHGTLPIGAAPLLQRKLRALAASHRRSLHAQVERLAQGTVGALQQLENRKEGGDGLDVAQTRQRVEERRAEMDTMLPDMLEAAKVETSVWGSFSREWLSPRYFSRPYAVVLYTNTCQSV